MPRRLMGPDPRQERATQQRLTSRIANAQAGSIQKAIRRAMRDAAEAFEAEGRMGIGPALAEQRPVIERTITGMYSAAWQTLGGRVLRAAKSLHGSAWQRKQSPDEQHAEALRQFIAQWSARRISMIQTTTDQQIKSIIERGEREGVGVDEIARRIRRNGPEMSRVRSQVIARTEVHNAGQAAQSEAAKAGGAAQRKEWFASIDDRTRDDRYSHVDADGEVVGVDEMFVESGEAMRFPGDPRGSSGNTVMCFAGETRVRGRFEAGTRVLYDGHVVRVQTRAGRDLTVTPNHPLMTKRGLRPAHRIDKGDRLVTDGRESEHAPRVGDHHRQHGPATIREVFGALSQMGASRSLRVRGVDFHGDGVRGQGDIDVVDIDGELWLDMEAALAQRLDYLGLVHAYAMGRVDVAARDPALGLERAMASARRLVRGAGVGLALAGRHALHPLTHRFAAPALAHAGAVESIDDDAAIDAERAGDRGDGLAVIDMALDEVIDVERVAFRGHVYDLQEASGLMIAEGIVTSNCRCGHGFIVD